MDAGTMGAFIASVRKERGMTQAELAAKLYVSDKTVSKWERGAGFPDIKTLEPLAAALDVSLVELMQGKRMQEPFLSAQAAEQLVADTIAISAPLHRLGRMAGAFLLLFFFCLSLFLLVTLAEYGRIVLYSVTSILLGLASWSIPLWSLTLRRTSHLAVRAWAAMSLASLSVGTQFFQIRCNVRAGDWASIEDTIYVLVGVVVLFLSISIGLTGLMLWVHRSRKAS